MSRAPTLSEWTVVRAGWSGKAVVGPCSGSLKAAEEVVQGTREPSPRRNRGSAMVGMEARRSVRRRDAARSVGTARTDCCRPGAPSGRAMDLRTGPSTSSGDRVGFWSQCRLAEYWEGRWTVAGESSTVARGRTKDVGARD